MSEKTEARCSCDAFADDPCPVHARENALQDELIAMRQRAETAEGKHRHTLHVMEGMQAEIDRWTARVKLLEVRIALAVSVLTGKADAELEALERAIVAAIREERERLAVEFEAIASKHGELADACGPERDRVRANLSGIGEGFRFASRILRRQTTAAAAPLAVPDA